MHSSNTCRRIQDRFPHSECGALWAPSPSEVSFSPPRTTRRCGLWRWMPTWASCKWCSKVRRATIASVVDKSVWNLSQDCTLLNHRSPWHSVSVLLTWLCLLCTVPVWLICARLWPGLLLDRRSHRVVRTWTLTGPGACCLFCYMLCLARLSLSLVFLLE